jgi:ABC-type polysaccharide/polyol phosphate transport system ATPase subunit
MAWAVKFEGVSKRYRRGGASYASLRHDLALIGRRAAVFLGRTAAEPTGTLALDRISFEVGEGEAFAIIGPNGAGKTTALKLLTRISYPTAGRVRVRGRVGALIEVGSGIHPELTGRENIWLYGRIMGMSRQEIASRFDEIVEFAELGNVLDAQVKTYSSGMQLRLGFAIASHLDPDIFVVDEALAVGDAGFQAKCVERMMHLVTEGRTLLFVSHNLSAVEAICRRGLFLLDGKIAAIGDTRNILRSYLNWVDEVQRQRKLLGSGFRGRGLIVEKVTLHESSGAERYVFAFGEPLEVRFHVNAEFDIMNPWFSLGINDGRPGTLVLCSMLEKENGFHISAGRQVVRCHLAPLPLGPRTYELWMSVREPVGAADLVDWSCVGAFRISHPDETKGVGGITTPWLYGPVRVEHRWSLVQGVNEPTAPTRGSAVGVASEGKP